MPVELPHNLLLLLGSPVKCGVDYVTAFILCLFVDGCVVGGDCGVCKWVRREVLFQGETLFRTELVSEGSIPFMDGLVL